MRERMRIINKGSLELTLLGLPWVGLKLKIILPQPHKSVTTGLGTAYGFTSFALIFKNYCILCICVYTCTNVHTCEHVVCI